MKRYIVSILLVVAMLVTMIPSAALAEDYDLTIAEDEMSLAESVAEDETYLEEKLMAEEDLSLDEELKTEEDLEGELAAEESDWAKLAKAMSFEKFENVDGVFTVKDLPISPDQTIHQITLEKDIKAMDNDVQLVTSPNYDMSLDLNGHVLDRGLTEPTREGRVFSVLKYLTIKDSKPTAKHEDPYADLPAGGIITGGNDTESGGAFNVSSGALLALQGGTIINNHADQYGGAVYVRGDAANNTFLGISGATLSNNSAYNGGAIFSNGEVRLQSGKVDSNEAKGGGGGIYISKTGLLEISFSKEICEITHNQAKEAGGGIYANIETLRSLNAVKVCDNVAGSFGGGIYIGGNFDKDDKDDVIEGKKNNPTTLSFTMKDWIIKNNTAVRRGGGVCIDYYDIGMQMIGGEISGNSVTADKSKDFNDAGGGGIWVGKSLTLGGSAVVKDNTLVNKFGIKTNNNVHVPVGKYADNVVPPIITINEAFPLTEGADIHISTDIAPTSYYSVPFTANGTEADAQYFTSDNSYYEIGFDNNQLVLKAPDIPYIPTGGGESKTTSYQIVTEPSQNGTFTVSKKSASSGSTVTITTAPDKGFTLETITVLDKNDKLVSVDNLGDGKYSFKMPASKVTVSVTFMEDNTMLNFFVDVKANDYFYDAVLWAAENNIATGVDSVHFDPLGSTTRAQMMAFIWRLAGSPDFEGGETPFTDIKKSDYFYDAVVWGWNVGIINGKTDTLFAPDDIVTRGEAVTFIYRYAKVAGGDLPNPFTDVALGKFYYYPVLWAANNEIVKGTSTTTFSPDAECTRGQVVTFLYRYNKAYSVQY